MTRYTIMNYALYKLKVEAMKQKIFKKKFIFLNDSLIFQVGG